MSHTSTRSLLARLRLRARCYALRIATVDRLERERNAAVRERDLIVASNERLAERAARAEHLVADRMAIGVAAELGAELQATGHRVTGDLVHDVDVAIDVERERRAQDHVAVARALWLDDPEAFAFHLTVLLEHVHDARAGQDRYERLRPALGRLGVVPASATDHEAIEMLAEVVRAAGAPRHCRACGSITDLMQASR